MQARFKKLRRALGLGTSAVTSVVSDPKEATRLLARSGARARARHYAEAWPVDDSARQMGGAEDGMNPLRDYFNANEVGPGIWKWEHYFGPYHRHLAKFVGYPVHITSTGTIPMKAFELMSRS